MFFQTPEDMMMAYSIMKALEEVPEEEVEKTCHQLTVIVIVAYFIAFFVTIFVCLPLLALIH